MLSMVFLALKTDHHVVVVVVVVVLVVVIIRFSIP